jgi:hypothetical protein
LALWQRRLAAIQGAIILMHNEPLAGAPTAPAAPHTELAGASDERADAPNSQESGLIEDRYDSTDEFDDGATGYTRIRSGLFAVCVTVASVLLLALLAGNVYQFIHYQRETTLATVNGAAVTQAEFDRAAGSSDQALQSLIDQKLIQQEAKRQKVTVPDSQVNAEEGTIKQQLGSEGEFAAALQRANLSEPQLRQQIRTRDLAQTMGAKGLTVGDDEAQTYFDQNKAQFGPQTFDQVKDQIKVQLLQSKQNEAIQTWIAGLRQRAKISIHIPA